MTQIDSEIAVNGVVVLTVLANVRQGAASQLAPVARKLPPQTTVTVEAIVIGDPVDNNAHWYRLNQAQFIWSGACGLLKVQAADASDVAPALGPPAMAASRVGPTPNVIDLYHGDQVTSFAEARAAGVFGIIHKATTGTSGRDDAYERRRIDATAVGLLWGAYHWGTSASAVDQVNNFLDWAKPDAKTLVALDYESDVGDQMTLQGARDFLTELGQRLQRKPVLYSGSLIKQALGDQKDEFIGSHKLWLPQYDPHPVVQSSWSKCWLWQFTEGAVTDPQRCSVAGLPGNAAQALDCSYYPGTIEQLAIEWAQ